MDNSPPSQSSKVIWSISRTGGANRDTIVSVVSLGRRKHRAKCKPSFLHTVWEEVQGQHFYTLLAIHSALLHGSSLAIRLSDPLAAEFYSSQASLIAHRLDEFWSPSKGIIRVSLNHTKGRESEENARVGDDTYGKGSELDTATLLAVLHSGKGTKWEQNAQVLATLDRLMEAFG